MRVVGLHASSRWCVPVHKGCLILTESLESSKSPASRAPEREEGLKTALMEQQATSPSPAGCFRDEFASFPLRLSLVIHCKCCYTCWTLGFVRTVSASSCHRDMHNVSLCSRLFNQCVCVCARVCVCVCARACVRVLVAAMFVNYKM